MPKVLEGRDSTSIHGGPFNGNPTATYQGTRPSSMESPFAVETNAHPIKGIERLMQVVSQSAIYHSDDRYASDPPKCLPGTRVAVLDKIINWATDTVDTDAFMLWLYGPAGVGKTAIARTVAEFCKARGFFLASFHFSRTHSERNTMTSFIPNIVYCVTCAIPGARELINTALEADPLILSDSVEAQFTKLVLEPLRLLVNQGYFSDRPFPRLVVIDGIDECLSEDAQTDLIRLLSSSVARSQLPLKCLIASRPEIHLKEAVSLAGQQSTISHLKLHDDFVAEGDIRRFLIDKFHEIKMYHPLRSQIPSTWPSEYQIDTLVRKASGLFMYASFAVDFINSAHDSPPLQLDIVLNHDLPFADLDDLYTSILSGTKNLDLVLQILGVNEALMVTDSMERTFAIESVLGLEGGDVRVYLSGLSSLLAVRDEQIFFHHASFMDFLRDPERAREYSIDVQRSHSLVTRWRSQAFASNSSGKKNHSQ
jgi:hypothetical protein